MTSWKTPISGAWTSPGLWDTGSVPGSTDSVFVSVVGNYTVSITSAITAASLTIGAPGASVVVVDPGGLVSFTGGLTNAGLFGLDSDNYTAEGGSTVTVAGTLTNTGSVVLGPATRGLSAATGLTVGALAGTGGIALHGGYGTSPPRASLTVQSAAPSVLTGNLALDGDALVSFASAQIATIASGVQLSLQGASAFVSDAGTVTSNSALSGLIENDGTLRVIYGDSVAIAGGLLNRGAIDLDGDSYTTEGGSTLTVAGTLTNTGTVVIGSDTVGLSAAAVLTAGALAGSGGIAIHGANGTAAARASLTVQSAAPGILSGNVTLDGNAVLSFASGQIGTIANGVQLSLSGPSAFVADAGTVTANSALSGLIENDGTLRVVFGDAVAIAGNLVNNGTIDLDGDSYSTEGGSTITVAGTLTNNGTVVLGPDTTGLSAATALTVGALAGNGGIAIHGGYGTTPPRASLTLQSGAPSVLTRSVSLDGNALLSFASGQIATITSGVQLSLRGPSAFVADAGTVTANSALSGLVENDGTLRVIYGDAVAIAGDLTNHGTIDLDGDSYSTEGGSTITVTGTLTNSGTVVVGSDTGGLSAAAALTAGALAGTGGIAIHGGNGASAPRASMTVLAAAPTILSENLTLDGDSLLSFASGQIGTIAAGIQLSLKGPSAFVADAGTVTSNSALSGLAENDGTLQVIYGDAVTIAGNLANHGAIDLDGDAYSTEGGSTITVTGILSNFGALTIGPSTAGLSSSATLAAGALANTGTVTLQGASAASQAVISSTQGISNAGALRIGTYASALIAPGGSFTQSAGTTTVLGVISAPTLQATGGKIDLLGGTIQGSALALLTGAALVGYGTVAAKIVSTAAIEASGGTLALTGGVGVLTAISIDAGAAADVAGADSSGVTFAGAGGALVIEQPAQFTGTISGLAISDTLVLRNTQATSAIATYDASTHNSTLAVAVSGGGTLDLTLAGDVSGEAFTVTQSGADSQIGVVGAAIGHLNNAVPIALGVTRGNAARSTPLSITNAALSGAVPLNVAIGAVSGGAAAAGTIAALAAGATDSTSIIAGLNPYMGGVQTGTITLSFGSDISGGLVAPLPSQAVTVTGTVYRLAQPEITPLVLYAHTGDPGVEPLSIRDAAPADGYSESLIASVTGATGGLTVLGAGPTGDIVPGASNTVAARLGFSTAQTGVVSGTAVLTLASDGGTGAGSIDGLGTIALPSESVPISINIDNYATAAFQAPANLGTLAVSGDTATLNLGTIAENSGTLSIGFGVANTSSGPADLLAGSFVASPASGFSLNGLNGFSGVGAGLAASESVTLDTTAGGVVSQTITLDPTGYNPGGYRSALSPKILTITGTVAPLPPPVITAPGTLAAMTSVPASLGLSIADPNADTLPLTVTITAGTGVLTASAAGQGTVSGSGTSQLVLTGDVATINNELAAASYIGAALGNDTVTVNVADQHNASATRSIAVAINAVPYTLPVFNGPANTTLVVGTNGGYGGLSVSDPYAQANGQPVTVVFGSQVGTLSVTGSYGGTIIGQGTSILAITGTVPQINAYLGDGLLEDIGAELVSQAFDYVVDKTVGFIKTGTIDLLPNAEDLIISAGGPESKYFQLGVLSASYALDALIGLLPGNEPPSLAEFQKGIIEIIGDPHIVGASGALYDFNAEGEFVLAASTQPGDSFDVQVRLQAYNNSPYASVVTQVAAQVGTDRVTFDSTRGDALWVDGTAAAVPAGGVLKLSGGQVSQTAANAWQISWNTGEVLTVTEAGGFLDTSIAAGPNNGEGSLVGLATLTQDPANQFQLVDGSILQSPLSAQSLYGVYANAWRVPQADSLLDYGAGQTTATFTNSSFPAADITLANLPASIVSRATAVVASYGITDPGAVAAAAFDYILGGGDPGIVAADASYLTGVTTTPEQATPTGPAPVAIGVIADQAQVAATLGQPTPVVFDVYLTAPNPTQETVNYAVVATALNALGASAFGGTAPTGHVTFAAGQVSARFTIDIPAGGLGLAPDSSLAVQVASSDGIPVFAPTAQTTIVQAVPGPPAVPVISDVTNLGTFSGGGTSYTLDLGDIQYGEPLPAITFRITNGATAPSDNLNGTLSVAPVEGFTVTGASLPTALGGGGSYQGMSVTVNSVKFGLNTETITFNPTDSNVTGYSAALAPVTLTIEDTIVPPTMVYSYAWGDVHIVTYNGLKYDFQGAGEFTLAQSHVPGDSFDIQLRLVPWRTSSSVSVISQVAVSVGTDKVTFDQSRPDTVWVDGAPSTISQSSPAVQLNGGTLTQISPSVWRVNWATGEQATVTGWGSFFNVTDGIPLSEPNQVGGLQGEDAGASNDFQLPNGTVLQQPLTTSVLYGEFANAWRVTPATSLFDYAPGQSTGTFTDLNFPGDAVSLATLPANLVANADAKVAAAGITDPGLAAAAALDYIATGDPALISATQQIATQVTNTVPVTVQPSTPPAPALGIEANPVGYTEAPSGPTQVTFDAYLTAASATATVVNYAVVTPAPGYLGASAFGGTAPSGSVTIAAGATLAPFSIALPQGALGTTASEQLDVQISTTGTSPLFVTNAIASIVNNTAEAGVAPIPQLFALSQAGTLTEVSPTSYTLNFGTLSAGQTLPQVQLALANDAAPPADSLSGTFGAPIGSGFLVTGNSLPQAIAAGARYEGLYLTPLTAATGANTETLTFTPRDVNPSGFNVAMTPITLTISDTVVPAGAGQLNTPGTIVFPNAHVGAIETHTVSVSNTGGGPIAVSATAQDPITVQGSIASLAAGATDNTSLTLGVNTGTAGYLSGVVDVTVGAADPPIDVFGDIYRLAAGTIAPIGGIVHVGDPGTIALTLANTDAADGFSENLLGTLTAVSGGASIAAAGPTGEIAAGSRDGSSLKLGFSTAQAGTITATATVALTSDGGTGIGSIDGLGTTALAPLTAPIAITVDNYAAPVFQDLSNTGTFAGGGTAYTLNLGTITQGSSAVVVGLGILNAAAGPSDSLSGSLQAVGSSAFINSGLAAFSGLAGGQADVTPSVTLTTGAAGTFSETITLVPTGSNASGYAAALANETLTVTGTVQAAAMAAAAASVLTPSPISFGDLHLGDSAHRTVAIQNAATAGSAALDASVGTVTGAATGSGTFASLAAGATNTSAIIAGLDTSGAGAKSGTIALAFVSDAGAQGTTSLPSQTIAVSGTVYREAAAAALLPLTAVTHVGAAGTVPLKVSNAAATDGYSEALIAALIGTSSGLNLTAAGSTGDIAPGANGTLGLNISTALAGTISGTATIGLTSDGGLGAGSIDGLGTTALSSQTVGVNIVVDNYAVPVLTGGAGLTVSGANTYTLNLGSTVQGAAGLSGDLVLSNGAVGPADFLGGTLTVNGAAGFTNPGGGTLAAINAGGSIDLGAVTLATTRSGVFTERLLLSPADGNSTGFSQALTPITIDVIGTITPLGGTATGDVHMVTFDGLHYDFQACGAYTLAESTAAGNSFDIQIETAAAPTYNAASVTTMLAARVGTDVVTVSIGQSYVVAVNGTPDTAIGAGPAPQLLDGGTLTELSPGRFLLRWTTGETVSITDRGAWLDTSVTLAADDGPGSVKGLLGANSGQANDFQLADGTILKGPLSAAEMYGAFADSWQVTAANDLFGQTPMRFLASDGVMEMQATAAGEVLSGDPGVGVLSDTGGFGVTFQGTIADLTKEILTGVSSNDLIDITDLGGASTRVSFTASANGGVVQISEGTRFGQIQVSGQLTGGLRVTPDAHGGTLIRLS